MLFVAQNLKNFGDQRAVDHHVVLAEIRQRLDAGAVFAFELLRPWANPRAWARELRALGGAGGGLVRRQGACRRGGCGFRRSGRSRCFGGRRRLVGSGFCFGLNRAGGSSFHAARSRGPIRRRLRFTFRRRGGRFGFVRHSCEGTNLGAVCVEKNVNFYQLEGAKSTGVGGGMSC